MEQQFIQRIQKHVKGATDQMENAVLYSTKRTQLFLLVGNGSLEELPPEKLEEYRELGESYMFAKDMYRHHVESIQKLIISFYRGNRLVCMFTKNPNRLYQHLLKISRPFSAFNALNLFPKPKEA
jgi:hypothetical protein